MTFGEKPRKGLRHVANAVGDLVQVEESLRGILGIDPSGLPSQGNIITSSISGERIGECRERAYIELQSNDGTVEIHASAATVEALGLVAVVKGLGYAVIKAYVPKRPK